MGERVARFSRRAGCWYIVICGSPLSASNDFCETNYSRAHYCARLLSQRATSTREKAMHRKVAAVIAVVGVFGTTGAFAQNYPERPVEITVPWTPGAVTDVLGRVLADGLSAELRQRFIVVNRPGATGSIGSAPVGHRSCQSRQSEAGRRQLRPPWCWFDSASGDDRVLPGRRSRVQCRPLQGRRRRHAARDGRATRFRHCCAELSCWRRAPNHRHLFGAAQSLSLIHANCERAGIRGCSVELWWALGTKRAAGERAAKTFQCLQNCNAWRAIFQACGKHGPAWRLLRRCRQFCPKLGKGCG